MSTGQFRASEFVWQGFILEKLAAPKRERRHEPRLQKPAARAGRTSKGLDRQTRVAFIRSCWAAVAVLESRRFTTYRQLRHRCPCGKRLP